MRRYELKKSYLKFVFTYWLSALWILEFVLEIGLYECIKSYKRNTMIIVKTHLRNSISPPPPPPSSFHSTKDKSHSPSILRDRGVFCNVFRDTTTFGGVWILRTTSLTFWKIWIPPIVFLVVVASAVRDASLDSVGEGRMEAWRVILRILVSNLAVRHVQYEGITSSIIFSITAFGCPLNKKLKLMLCLLRSTRTKVYSQFGTGMINPEVVIAPLIVFES